MRDKARWQVCFEAFDAQDERRREALLALGNGQLSWRASAPETAAAAADGAAREPHYAGFYRAGWYDDARRDINGESVHLEALANLPDPFGLSVSVDGRQWFGAADVPQPQYRQSLRMDRARLEREVDFVLAGHTFHLREVRLLSLADPQLAVLRWELECPPGTERLFLRSVLDGGVENALVKKNRAYEGKRLLDLCMESVDGGRAALSAQLSTPGRRLAMAMQTLHNGAPLPWQCQRQGERLLQQTECRLAGSHRLVIEKRVVVQVDDELPGDAIRARRQVLERLPSETFARLALRHSRAWRELWSWVPLALSNAELEQPLRLHAFHLLQTLSPRSLGQDLGFPPRGWHEGYFGQVFWDEIFAYPFLCTHFPELAQQLLHYRYQRLDEARQRARRAGLRGAMFPWRSADSGREQTPPFQCNPLSGHWMPDHTERQRHIGSAIAHDAWQLYLATGDEALLAGEVGELILEIARFWASLAQWNSEHGRFMIHGVIGPDEYHNFPPDGCEPGLSNNAYTNLMAVWALRLGLLVLDSLPDSQAEDLGKRLAVTPEERDSWGEIAGAMYLPIRPDGVLDQFEGAERLEPGPDAWRHDDRPRLDWMLEAHGDRPDRYRLTKQPDVLMLLYLFPQPTLQGLVESLGYSFDQQALRRTAEFHLSNITHESSLSIVVCAGAMARLDPQASWSYFQQSMGIDLNAPSQGGTLEGVHLGAMAGSLDVLQRHYLGIRPEIDSLHVFPSPPAALGDVEIAVGYRGARLRVVLEGSNLFVHAEATNLRDTPIRHAGGLAPLPAGACLTLPCSRR
ncbi:glycoside hydrolase family 65 protein [Stutzerimonas azotifigens]|uniref:Glycoside hydrolase family 65 protein n=1 Tax=Stutzerimonas azotifigens TaxID=291995 RepID=A0ABR5Z700_9GAMM|nr:glycoside hydrolase family 65 protein [Stutzerimonas azotifigens]MBA1275919.1 glycoside hydrolase family 65 protein [Stutzerimonas azotifigens]